MTNIIYENLKDEMETEGISIGDIAATMDIKEERLRSLLSGEEPLGALSAHNIMSKLFPGTDMSYLFHIENGNDNLKELIQNLDSEFGSMMIEVEDLKALNTELGRVMEIMEEVDQSDLTSMGLSFRDIFSTVRIIDSLLHHSVNSLSEHYGKGFDLKTKLFQGIIHRANDND